MSKSEVLREILRRAFRGFPWGVALVYLVFVTENAFAVPAPSGGNLLVVPEAMAEAYGSPVTAALVQMLWSGLLGAALGTAEVPFLLERRTLLWSGAHVLVTAVVFFLMGWQCKWFPDIRMWDTWWMVLLFLLLGYVVRWAVRFLGWQADLRAMRRAAGLDPDPVEPPGKAITPYLLLAAGMEILAPLALVFASPLNFWALAGLVYPYIVLPFFCFLSTSSLASRFRRWWLIYPPVCMLMILPTVFIMYNSSALFFVGIAGVTSLAGGLVGTVLRRLKKRE